MSKHLVQLWYLNRQRHCLSPSQRLSYTVGGKSHRKQRRGQETPLLQLRCTPKSSPGRNPPAMSSATITSGPFKSVSHLFTSWDLCPPIASSPSSPLSWGGGVTADLCRQKTPFSRGFQWTRAQPLPAAHMSSNKFLFIARMFWPSRCAPCMPVSLSCTRLT